MTAHDPEENPWDEDLCLGPVDLNRMTVDGTWRIEDEAEANWALRKLDRAQREIQRVNENARREIERITVSKNAAVKSATDDVGFFTAALIDYRHRLEQADPDLPKTYRLPSGVITRRKPPTRIEVTDEKTFIDWAEGNDPSLLKRTPLVSRLTDQKDRYQFEVYSPTGDLIPVTDNGEIVPGVRQVRDQDVYGAKPT